jgi:hypothetical protein
MGFFQGARLLARHRWDYPYDLNSKVFQEREPICAEYITDNWRAFRTWGVSAISPWEHAQYWKLRDGVDRERKELKVDWRKLQRPGFSADYVAGRYERMDLAYDRGDWLPTETAEALLRNNRPLLAYLGGKPDAFTSKDHNFLPGETVEKQVIVLNSSRQTVTCECSWSLRLPPGRRRNHARYRADGRTGARAVVVCFASVTATG